MTGRIANILGFLLLGAAFWPWLGNPLDYVNWSDRFKTSIPVALTFGFPCETRENGAIFRDRSPDCFRFGQPEEFSGIWIDEFERSVFVEGAVSAPRQRPSYEESAWLSIPKGIFAPERLPATGKLESECHGTSVYRIEFVGRERHGDSGHGGLWDREIWVDRISRIENLKVDPCIYG